MNSPKTVNDFIRDLHAPRLLAALLGTLLLATSGRYIGPGHASLLTRSNQDWLVFHYYDGEDRGRPKGRPQLFQRIDGSKIGRTRSRWTS